MAFRLISINIKTLQRRVQKNNMLRRLLCCFVCSIACLLGQESTLSFSEYLAYVKKYHPIVKQANLLISESEAKLLKARGAFDPKLDVDIERKLFKSINYFTQANTAFKIPTWYGVEIKGSFEDNTGVFLNPEASVPENGLYSAGIVVPLAKNLLINERMATLRKARLYQSQSNFDNQLLVNEILYQSARAYFTWLKTYKETKVHQTFLENAQVRFESVRKNYELGESPAVDTTEARIFYANRQLELEKATLAYTQSSLILSNYLWINELPVEISDQTFPDTETFSKINEALNFPSPDAFTLDFSIHPKIRSLDFKYKMLEIDRRVYLNNFLPEVNFNYNFLTETPQTLNTFNTSNYKTLFTLNFPVFLRKEQADLKLIKLKLQGISYERQSTLLVLRNKIASLQQEIASYETQLRITNRMISDYKILVKSEERKFEIGESSLFLLNSRESKWIESQLKNINQENKILELKAKFLNTLGILDE